MYLFLSFSNINASNGSGSQEDEKRRKDNSHSAFFMLNVIYHFIFSATLPCRDYYYLILWMKKLRFGVDKHPTHHHKEAVELGPEDRPPLLAKPIHHQELSGQLSTQQLWTRSPSSLSGRSSPSCEPCAAKSHHFLCCFSLSFILCF